MNARQKYNEAQRVRLQILKLRAEGLALKEIANRLEVEYKTVEYHYQKLVKSLGIYDVALLTQYALKHGIARWVV